METFTPLKDFVDNPHFEAQRKAALFRLDLNSIDAPIRGLVDAFSKRPCCYTLQSCRGHFVYVDRTDPHNLDPLPDEEIPSPIEYRIAYVALVIENSREGKKLFDDLSSLTAIDPGYIQFGCAGWFWKTKKRVNSYALQVEPERYKDKDRCFVAYPLSGQRSG